MNKMEKEEELSHFIYEVLSPEENSEYGRLYLELFDKYVLRLGMTADELDSAKVEKKYWAGVPESKRKMDLTIITNRRFMPIKVNTEDGRELQCRNYLQEANSYTKKHKLKESPLTVYITPSGYYPESRKTLDLNRNYRANLESISLRSEIFQWIKSCFEQTPENFSCIQKLERLQTKILELIGKTEPQLEEIMYKFFTALDKRFDESFCKEYHLKRGSNLREEVGDYESYQREIKKFYGTGFSVPGIGLLCTNAAGKVINLASKKELWFRVECYNDGENWNDIPKTLCVGFIIFDYTQNDCLYEKSHIQKFLSEKNILPEEFIETYAPKFAGVVGRTELHDAYGNTIDFHDVDKTLTQFRTQEDIDGAVEHIMTEIKNLLERFVYG